MEPDTDSDVVFRSSGELSFFFAEELGGKGSVSDVVVEGTRSDNFEIDIADSVEVCFQSGDRLAMSVSTMTEKSFGKLDQRELSTPQLFSSLPVHVTGTTYSNF